MAPAFRSRQRGSLRAFVAIVCLIAAVPAGSRAQDTDPLDLRATDWRHADWQALDADERRWTVMGFGIGWHGLTDGTPAAPEAPNGAVKHRQTRITAHARGQPNRRIAALLAAAQVDDPLPPIPMTGHDWMALVVRHKLALLHGFYAGSYGRALADRPGARLDEAALDTAFAEARRLVRPDLALAPSLLFARLSDWYFYTNHRDAPLVRAIETIVRQIKDPDSAG